MTQLSIRMSKRTKQLFDRIERFGDRRVLMRELQDAFQKESKFAEARAVFYSKKLMRTRSGALSQSIVGTAAMVDRQPAVRVGIFRGPALAYAGVQEHGTVGKGGTYPTIRPKKAKSLAVPTQEGGALTPAGLPRYRGPRSFPERLAYIPIHKGKVVGLLVRERDLEAYEDLRQINAVYILMRSVDIEPKHYLRKGMEDSIPRISKAITRTVTGVFSGVS